MRHWFSCDKSFCLLEPVQHVIYILYGTHICSQTFEWHPNFDTASAIWSNWKRCCFQRMSSCFRAQEIMFTHNCIMGYIQVIQGHCFVLILLMEEILHQLICSLCHYLQVFIHPGWCRISSINSSIRWVEVLSISSTLRIQISIWGTLHARWPFSSTISFIPSSLPGSQDQLRKEQLVQAPGRRLVGAEDPMIFNKSSNLVPPKTYTVGSQNLPELHVNKRGVKKKPSETQLSARWWF